SAVRRRADVWPRYILATTTARTPDTPARSAARNATFGVSSDMLLSSTGLRSDARPIQRRSDAMHHPAARPNIIPPPAAHRKLNNAGPSENVPVLPAVSAISKITSDVASLTRLSPSRIETSVRGTPNRRITAVAATASVGPTAAPSANAAGQDSIANIECATTATTTAVATTSPIASSMMSTPLRRNSRHDVFIAAQYSKGGR